MSPTPREPLPLSCEEALDRLEAFVDGDLPNAEAIAVRAHVEGAEGHEACARCARELGLARAIAEGLRALPQETCPPAVVERAFETARREEREERGGEVRRLPTSRHSRPEERDWWLGLAAAAAVLLIVGLFALTRLVPDDPTPAAVAEAVAPDSTGAEPTFDPSSMSPSTMSEEEIERATEEARLALAYVASIGRRSALVLRDEVVGDNIIAPSARALQRAIEPLRPLGANTPAGAETGDRR